MIKQSLHFLNKHNRFKLIKMCKDNLKKKWYIDYTFLKYIKQPNSML